jgi:hypothetical protein
MRYTEEIAWGDPMMGIPNVYHYTGETGVVYVKHELKNIVKGTFSSKVWVTFPSGPKAGVRQKTTQRQLKNFIETGTRVESF